MARTTDDPRSQMVTLRLTASEADELNDRALRLGKSRSTVLREAVFPSATPSTGTSRSRTR